MDFLRSCYQQKIKFLRDDPMQEENAVWYFASKTAKPFPCLHPFGSPTWDIIHPTHASLGFKEESPRRYYNGRPLNSSRGERFAGLAASFEKGAVSPASLPRALNGTPVECLRPPFGLALSAVGRDVLGTVTSLSLSARSVCGPIVCADVPATLEADITAATGPWDVHIGSTISLTLAFGVWSGEIGVDEARIRLEATCSSGVWSIVALLGFQSASSPANRVCVPVNFSPTLNGPIFGDVSFHVHPV